MLEEATMLFTLPKASFLSRLKFRSANVLTARRTTHISQAIKGFTSAIAYSTFDSWKQEGILEGKRKGERRVYICAYTRSHTSVAGDILGWRVIMIGRRDDIRYSRGEEATLMQR
jgi:hypothetical protein